MRGIERSGEGGDRATARDAHASGAARVELRAGFDPVDGAHHIVDAPADHGLAEQQGGAGRGLASGRLRAFVSGEGVAPAAEGQRLDGDRGHAVLDHLDGEIVLIAGFAGAIAALFVDAHDIVHAAPMAGNADHHRMRRRGSSWCEQIAQDKHAGPAFEDELLAAIRWKVAYFQRLRIEGRGFRGKAAQQLSDFGAQAFLPRFSLLAVLRAERELQRGRFVEFTGVKNRIEGCGIHFVFETLQRACVLVLSGGAG